MTWIKLKKKLLSYSWLSTDNRYEKRDNPYYECGGLHFKNKCPFRNIKFFTWSKIGHKKSHGYIKPKKQS